MLLVYEIGTLIYAANEKSGQLYHIKARMLLTESLEWFGASGYYLPGLLVVMVLLTLHIVRRDPWRADWRIFPWMALESLVLTLPLLMLSLTLQGRPGHAEFPWQVEMVFSIGAGIYEEMVFRMMAIALLHAFLVDGLKMTERRGAWITIAGSAALFAFYHFVGTDIRFTFIQFAYYFIAGLYLAWLYVLRGFGIVVATHVAFDILISGLKDGGWMGIH